MFRRVASRMRVDPGHVEVVLLASPDRMTSRLVPYYASSNSGAAGIYHPELTHKTQISIDEDLLKDPTAWVKEIAHKLGHVLLQHPGLVNPKEKDMEPLTNLLTAFLRFGVLSANAAFRFKQYISVRSNAYRASA